MGIKRVVDVDFWNDSKVIDYFSPEDKYFMLYLLTNPHTTQLGIYELNIKRAAFEMGYSTEAITVLLERFEIKYNMIKYSEKSNEVAIKNFLRHSIIKGGKPVEDLLKKEIKSVKDKSLLNFVFGHLAKYDNLNETVNKITAVYQINNENDNDNDNDNDNENDNEVSYHDTCNDSSKPSKQAKSKKKPIIYDPDEELNQAILDFIDFRKKIRASMTDRAITLMINKLNKMANDNDEKIAILEQSIMNGWKSVYPIKNDKKYGKQSFDDFVEVGKEWLNDTAGVFDDSSND
mgnify:CR=1 FL=1